MVNAAPTASDRTVTTHEDTDYTFAAADFNLSRHRQRRCAVEREDRDPARAGQGHAEAGRFGHCLGRPAEDRHQGRHRRRQTDLHPAGERQRIGLREFYLQGQRRHRRQRLRLHADDRRDGAERPGDGDRRGSPARRRSGRR